MENIYEEATSLNNSNQQMTGSSRKNKRCRSNNSSILSRTFTSSSSSCDISGTGDHDSRSQSPDIRVLDSNDDEIDIVKENEEFAEGDIDEELSELRPKSRKFNQKYSYNQGSSSGNLNSHYSMQHSTPVLRVNNELIENSQNTKFNDENDAYNQKIYSAISPAYASSMMMPSPNLYSANSLVNHHVNHSSKAMQFMSPLANLAEQHSYQNNKPISMCAVCGDRASGKHYGVLSCDGCRGFFKRSIRGNMDYVCKENNKCIIDVSRRNQCQSCRLKKCLEVKMNKDAVQHQRPPRSYQIRRDSACNSNTETSANQKFYLEKMNNDLSNNNKLNQTHSMNSTNPNLFRFSPYSLSPMSLKNRTANQIEQSDFTSSSLSSSSTSSSASSSSSSITAALMANSAWNHLPFSSEFLMNSLANSASFSYLTSPAYNNGLNFSIVNPTSSQTTQMNATKTAFNSAFKNINSFNMKNRSLINSSFASSGYNTSDDTNDLVKTETDLKETSELTKKSLESVSSNCKFNSNASLAHIMNWIKSEPNAENFNELTSRILYSALKWTRTQRNFVNLPLNDQVLLLNDCLNELFILQVAENKSALTEVFVAEKEENEEKKKFLSNFQQTLQKFSLYKVDLMEFYLLKSIVLFKSDLKNLQEKSTIESIQEECFNTLFNYNKLNYPSTARFGRLITLYTDIRKNTQKLIDESFLKTVLGKNDMADILIELNK